MIIKIVDDEISLDELRKIAAEYYIDMVKGVVDVSKEIIAFGGEYHMDANVRLLENGSLQNDVWGFNLYIDRPEGDRIEFTSLINIRPKAGNRSMEIESEALCEKMRGIINRKII